MSEDNFIHEVTEELKREKLNANWRKYGPLFIGIVIAIILITSIYQAYISHEAKQSAKIGDKMFEALLLSETNKDAALKKLIEIQNNKINPNYSYLSAFKQASILQTQNKLNDAIKTYDSIISDPNASKWMQNIATIKKAYSLVETSNLKDLILILAPCLQKDNIFQPMAQEALGLCALKHNDLKNAQNYFNLIVQNDKAPRDLERRAAMMLWVIQTEINNIKK